MALVPFEYKLCTKGASHTKVLEGKSTCKSGWYPAGPDGNQRLLEMWMDNGLIGKEFFRTVAPMIAYKLKVQAVTAQGLVLVRSNEAADHQVWFARPKGDRLLFFADINKSEQEDGKVWCGIRRLSGEVIWEDVQLVVLVNVFWFCLFCDAIGACLHALVKHEKNISFWCTSGSLRPSLGDIFGFAFSGTIDLKAMTMLQRLWLETMCWGQVVSAFAYVSRLKLWEPHSRRTPSSGRLNSRMLTEV